MDVEPECKYADSQFSAGSTVLFRHPRNEGEGGRENHWEKEKMNQNLPDNRRNSSQMDQKKASSLWSDGLPWVALEIKDLGPENSKCKFCVLYCLQNWSYFLSLSVCLPFAVYIYSFLHWKVKSISLSLQSGWAM